MTLCCYHPPPYPRLTYRAAINRRLAEWLEPEPKSAMATRCNGRVFHQSALRVWSRFTGEEWRHCDFFADESASAMLLEKMPLPVLQCALQMQNGGRKTWGCTPDRIAAGEYVWHQDRKTAIALAAYELAKAGK